jgi:hypothetical protein
MLASRSKDPSVIVDVPQDPTAEEVDAARKADALMLPGMRVDGTGRREAVSGIMGSGVRR